ncbi:hypothetical protein BVY01_04840 [bacterium I07]|nr:hypothetical protein BVY01_04840 [bacterium I07]
MRNMIVVMSVLLFAGFLVAQQAGNVEKEKVAIKKVIEAGFNEYWNNKNYEAWANVFVHDRDFHAIAVKKSGYEEDISWESVNEKFKKRFEDTSQSRKFEYIFENFSFRIWKDAAFVSFDYYRKRNKEKDPDYIPIRAYGVFEKTKDGWKYISWMAVYKNSWRDTE